jgi:hypothetical protein
MSKQFRRSDASKLSEEHVKHIISLRNTIPNAARVAAKLYKISTSRVYQIWKSGTELAQHTTASEPIVNPLETKKIIDLNAQLFSITETTDLSDNINSTINDEYSEVEELRLQLIKLENINTINEKKISEVNEEKLKLQNDVDRLRTIINKLIS